MTLMTAWCCAVSAGAVLASEGAAPAVPSHTKVVVSPARSGDATPPPAPSDGAKPAVSMSELRDMIDNKISQVRAQQREAPPVLQVKSRSAPARTAARRAAPAAAALASVPGQPVWAYDGERGPEHWHQLRPEFKLCGTGRRQSPIDVRDGIPVQLDPIHFEYRPSAFKVIDNGHTVQVNMEPGNRIRVNARTYELVAFHFHRPADVRLNGRQFDMVAHLVHKDHEGQTAIIAVLLEAGSGHPVVQQVWNDLPLEKHIEQPGLQPLDLLQLLPEDRRYATFMGSLTTPPCTEGVLWMVLKQPVQVSSQQISIFSRLYPMNARPIQPLNGRLIKDGQ